MSLPFGERGLEQSRSERRLGDSRHDVHRHRLNPEFDRGTNFDQKPNEFAGRPPYPALH